MGRRPLLLAALFAMVVSLGPWALPPATAAATELFFSEYIEGSSNNKALEIFNGTGAAVDLGLAGYNVQMCFNGNPSCSLTIALTGTVAAGDVFVLAQATASAAILAQADQTNGSGWFNGDDAVVLRRGSTVIDVIGQIGLDPGTEWGTGLTSTADNTLRRKSSVTAGDTNGSNAFDPAAEWDGFATDDFSDLGNTTAPPPDPLVCGAPATAIHAVQGSGSSTPISGTSVEIEGVVVGDYQPSPTQFGGFFLQEEDADADADPTTSEGIFVFHGSTAPLDVSPGDVVRVRGTAIEFSSLTEVASVSAMVVCSTGATVTPAAVTLPVASLTALERYEGMRVTLGQPLTVTEVFGLGRFGEVVLSASGRLYTPTAVAAPGAPAQALADLNRRSRIVLDDGNNQQNTDPTRYPQGGLSATNTLRVGDTLAGGLTGVMDYRFGAYRVQPVGAIEFAHTNPRPAAPDAVGGDLRVASFNVLNFFNGDGTGGGFPTARGASSPEELARQLAKEVSALSAIDADIVGLMEIENDAGPTSALADLVEALNTAMGAGTYAYVDTGVTGTDQIKVALIYKPATAIPVGAFEILTSSDDPRFLDTLNRPSLAQTFEHVLTGERLTVVVNHLKSKGSACAGDPDTGDGQGNCNGTRTAAAEALADWIAADPTGSGDTDVLVIGDLNSYTFEDPIAALESAGLTNLVRSFAGTTAYSYVFQGESGYLDHALATPSLVPQVTGVTEWHINPDEPVALDYNLEFKSANHQTTLYDAGPYRSSDHDPVIVGVRLATTAGTGGKLEGTPQWAGGVKTKLNVISSGGATKGRVTFEGDGRYYVSTVVHSIVVSGDDATVFGEFGDVRFRLDVHDGGPDREDTLRLRTSDGYDSGVLAQARGNLTVWP